MSKQRNGLVKKIKARLIHTGPLFTISRWCLETARAAYIRAVRTARGIDKNKIVFSCLMARTYGDNLKPISEMLHAKRPDAKIVWMFRDPESKKGVTPDGYFDYTVYPLEALWKQIEHTEQFDKNNLQYRVMIRQPDFVTSDVLEAAIINVSKKKSLPRFKDVRLESIEDGDCVQILHVGPYDDEPESFMKVDEFCSAHNLQRVNDEWHREIYLSDARKVEPAKLKTVLRVQVKRG